ncbi:hypothetical protein NDU88_006343 [Pleurodeles waltl]|uniref:Uncharacterized protein n=1 Tax=Pleurodeles waltl TaxID=8319 RepID=A0AAV7VR98_PLEWA|nr:hypothetical protein NDU88_006343 [Pleurodeles waltl]
MKEFGHREQSRTKTKEFGHREQSRAEEKRRSLDTESRAEEKRRSLDTESRAEEKRRSLDTESRAEKKRRSLDTESRAGQSRRKTKEFGHRELSRRKKNEGVWTERESTEDRREKRGAGQGGAQWSTYGLLEVAGAWAVGAAAVGGATYPRDGRGSGPTLGMDEAQELLHDMSNLSSV